MSYYNDFSLALEQQSNELDNMLAELDNISDFGNYSEALESVQNTVAGMYDIDACEELLGKLSDVTESYNSALEQMRDAGEMYQYTNDVESFREATIPAQESLKSIYNNMIGHPIEGSINREMVSEIRNFLTGSRDIIEEKINELGGMRSGMESYNIFYPTTQLDAAIEQARFEYEDAMAGVYACMEAEYEQYGYAFESEASGAEKAKKEGLFQRAKNAFVKWCAGMAGKCAKKRSDAKNGALRSVWNAFYGVFMRLSGQGKTLKEERALEKAQKEAQKETEKLKKQVAAAGGSESEVPNAPFSEEDYKAERERRDAKNAVNHGKGVDDKGKLRNQEYYETGFGVDEHGLTDQQKLDYKNKKAKSDLALNAHAWGTDIGEVKSMVEKANALSGSQRKKALKAAKAKAKAVRDGIIKDKAVTPAKQKIYEKQLNNISFENALRIIDGLEVAIESALSVDDGIDEFFGLI